MMSKKNVLILSAGRRVGLLETFRSAAKNLNINSQIFTADSNPRMSAACHLSTRSFKLPPHSDKDFICHLLNVCKKNNISLVVPTTDTELEVLSKNRQSFLKYGINIVVSDTTLIEKCSDKRKTPELFDSFGISCPKIYTGVTEFPCFCKPCKGSGGHGTKIINNSTELELARSADANNIFCEFVGPEFTEYTVDAYYSKSGVLVCLVPRERQEVRGGEVSKGCTRKNILYEELKNALSCLHGARGCVTLQFFFNQSSSEIKGVEINPRFGGGYPLSYRAGALYSDWIIKEYILDKELAFFDGWESDLTMLRYDQAVYYEG